MAGFEVALPDRTELANDSKASQHHQVFRNVIKLNSRGLTPWPRPRPRQQPLGMRSQDRLEFREPGIGLEMEWFHANAAAAPAVED